MEIWNVRAFLQSPARPPAAFAHENTGIDVPFNSHSLAPSPRKYCLLSQPLLESGRLIAAAFIERLESGPTSVNTGHSGEALVRPPERRAARRPSRRVPPGALLFSHRITRKRVKRRPVGERSARRRALSRRNEGQWALVHTPPFVPCPPLRALCFTQRAVLPHSAVLLLVTHTEMLHT